MNAHRAALICSLCLLVIRCSADGLDTWQWRNPVPQGHTLRGVGIVGGQSLGVGVSGTIVASANLGQDWSIADPGITNTYELRAVAHGNGKFVAVGTQGRLLNSSDASNWSRQVYAAGTASFNDVTFGNGAFVAVGQLGSTNLILSSPDGVNWTQRAPGDTRPLFAVTFNNNVFVAVGSSGAGGVILTSPDGTIWTPRYTDPSYFLSMVTYGNGLFHAFAGTTRFTSSDGSMWTGPIASDYIAGGAIRAVTFGNGQFVMADYRAIFTSSRIYSSANGTNWVARTGDLSDVSDVTFGDNTFLAVGLNGQMLRSTNGTSWTTISSSGIPELTPFLSSLVDVGHADGTTLVLAGGGSLNGVIYRSTNGVSFDQVSFGQSGTFYRLGSGNGIWTAVGAVTFFPQSFAAVQTSSNDGQSWTTYQIGDYGTLRGVTFGNGQFVAVGASPGAGTNSPVLTSTDGVQWALQDSGTNLTLSGVAYGNGVYVAVTGTTNVLVSADGTNWMTRGLGVSAFPTAITFANGQFVGVGGFQAVRSVDGNIWTLHATGAAGGLLGITHGGDAFLAVGSAGAMVSSTNGMTWTPHRSGTFHSLNGVAFANNSFLAVGSRGVVLESGTGGVLPSAPILSNPRPLAGGEFEFDITAPLSQMVQIRATTNFTAWDMLGAVTITNVPQPFRDSAADAFPRRFYQGVVP